MRLKGWGTVTAMQPFGFGHRHRILRGHITIPENRVGDPGHRIEVSTTDQSPDCKNQVLNLPESICVIEWDKNQ